MRPLRLPSGFHRYFGRAEDSEASKHERIDSPVKSKLLRQFSRPKELGNAIRIMRLAGERYSRCPNGQAGQNWNRVNFATEVLRGEPGGR
jgi:hypothetical protein